MTDLATGGPPRSEEAEARGRQSRTKAMRAIVISSRARGARDMVQDICDLAAFPNCHELAAP